MVLLFLYPLNLLLIPGLMAVPYYFYNRYLLRKLRPRESSRNLLVYFLVTILAAFVYISIGVFLIIRVAVYFKKF